MTATFFGHRDTPLEIETELRLALTDLIKNKNVTVFYVGNNGSFDYMVKRVLEDLSVIYPINYNIALPYLPVKKNEYENFENTVFPEGLETVPKRFAISYRNKWMVEQADIIVTYVSRNFGGAWKFKEVAERKGKRIIELSKSSTLNTQPSKLSFPSCLNTKTYV